MPAVTLDLWHTLVYLSPEDEEAYMAHQIAIGTEVLRDSPRAPGAPDLSDVALGRLFEKAYANAVAEAGMGRTVTSTEQLARAARESGRRADSERYLEMLKAEVARTPMRRAPGAVELLRDLRDAGYRVGIISNTVGEPGAFLRPILTTMGFDPFVETYTFSDELPWTKPAPEIFRTTLSRLDVSPKEAVHVGDAWADIEGARRAGYRGSILFTGLHRYGARYREMFMPEVPETSRTGPRADRLEDVAGLVRKLLSSP